MVNSALIGFATSFSLILAIGAQNAFVLRQGLRGQHVLAVVLICAISDAVLISIGVGGFARLGAALPKLAPIMRIAGAAFLLIYGARSLLAAWRGGQGGLEPASEEKAGLWQAALICLALTWLNPHVYLDTLMLIGAVSLRYEALWFGLGAISASFFFFFSLGYGARLLRPWFAEPRAWRWLDAGIGLVMWAIALGLLRGF
ncbi:MAG: L-lysine exporter family protein LysE/ArgO [Halocynthiibacter sp.]|jgi:L-lysine exporter family protein LysE/ArgO